MTRPGIEPRSPGPLTNTLTIKATNLEKKILNSFKPAILSLKIDLVSQPAHGGGAG